MRWLLVGLPISPALAINCFSVFVSNTVYSDDDVLGLIEQWLASGAQVEAPSTVQQVLRPTHFEYGNEACPLTLAGYSLASAIVNGRSDVESEVWNALIGLPMENITRSNWPLLELLSHWVAGEVLHEEVLVFKGDFVNLCGNHPFWMDRNILATGSVAEVEFLANGSLSASTVELAARSALAHRFTFMVGQGNICELVAGLITISLLVLIPHEPFVTPGYALRLLQTILQQLGFVKESALKLAAVPWPVWDMITYIASLERANRAGLDIVTLHDFAVGDDFKAVEELSSSQLAETVDVTQSFLAALEMPYIIVAGTLLGAVRHLGRIPWDDDVDLCIDANRHIQLVDILLEQEVARMGMDFQQEQAWQYRRALLYLEQKSHYIKLVASRSLTFTISHMDAGPDGPHVDLWECWGLEDDTAPEVRWASKQFGVSLPRDAIVPRRKMPFGELTLWGPADPVRVTNFFFVGGDWRSTCVGRKVHAGNVVYDYDTKIPCAWLQDRYEFATDWESGDHVSCSLAEAVITRLLTRHLPGLKLHGFPACDAAASGLGDANPLRTRLKVSVHSIDGNALDCEGLLWSGRSIAAESIAPGATALGVLPVLRSFVCGAPGREPSYVWEDTWL